MAFRPQSNIPRRLLGNFTSTFPPYTQSSSAQFIIFHLINSQVIIAPSDVNYNRRWKYFRVNSHILYDFDINTFYWASFILDQGSEEIVPASSYFHQIYSEVANLMWINSRHGSITTVSATTIYFRLLTTLVSSYAATSFSECLET